MRRLLVWVVTGLLAVATGSPAWAGTYPNCEWDPTDPGVCAEEPREEITTFTRVTVDGKVCSVAAIVRQAGRVYLPLRAFSECLGLSVHWFPDSNILGGTAVISGVAGIGRPFTAYFHPQSESPRVKVVTDGVKERHFSLKARPFIWKGSTMVPFRFITDLADLQVEWIGGNESRPNEVKVTTTERAVPLDEWEEAVKHVGYDKAKGFFLLDEPKYGWELYPATLRHVEVSLELHSRILAEQKPTIDWNGFRVRVQGEYGPRDYFGPVAIIWFADEEQAMKYITALESTQRNIKSGVGVISAGISLWFGQLHGAVATVSSFLGINASAWSIWSEDWTATVKLCSGIAALGQFKDHRPEGAPAIWGMAITPSGEKCVPYYSDLPLDIMREV